MTRIELNAPTYSNDEALAAMCLWEVVLEQSHAVGRLPAPWDEDRENEGTCALRDRILDMAKLCERDWEEAHPEFFDEPFDWEFAPQWLCHNYEALRDGQRRDDSLAHRRERLAWLNVALPTHWQLYKAKDGAESLSLDRLADRRCAVQHQRMMELNHPGWTYSVRPAWG